jgi:hypothetical protein
MTTVPISILCLTTLGLIFWMIRSRSQATDGERAAWLLIQENQTRAYETMMSEQRLATEHTEATTQSMVTQFSTQLSSLMEAQSQLLKRVLVGEDLVSTSPELRSTETPNDDSMTLAEELLLLPPHIRDQVIREEAEKAFYENNDPSQDPSPSRIDPRVKVVDPTRTRDEGSVIWSPPSSGMVGG